MRGKLCWHTPHGYVGLHRNDRAEPVGSMISATLRTRHLSLITGAILKRSGTSINDFGFFYPNPQFLDPCDELWEGVEVHAFPDEARVSEPDFEALMCRAIRLYLHHCPFPQQTEEQRAEYAEILHNLEQIEARIPAEYREQSAEAESP